MLFRHGSSVSASPKELVAKGKGKVRHARIRRMFMFSIHCCTLRANEVNLHLHWQKPRNGESPVKEVTQKKGENAFDSPTLALIQC